MTTPKNPARRISIGWSINQHLLVLASGFTIPLMNDLAHALSRPHGINPLHVCEYSAIADEGSYE